MKPPKALQHTPTLGESLDHYGEEYCTRAVNAHEELKAACNAALEVLGKLPGSAQVGTGYIGEVGTILMQAIARAEGR